MAMSKGMKIGLSVAAVGITGTIVYMLIKKMKAKKEALLELDDKIIRTPVSTTPVSTSTTPVSTGISLGSTPFTNKTQGNAFRAWINDTYPAYAKGIDLDRTGSYNNSYIKKAWEAYGSAYETARTNALQGITTPVSVPATVGEGIKTAGKEASTFSAERAAKALHKSMDGIQIRDREFWDITNDLTLNEREQVKTYFDANLGGVDGSKLCNWIEEDFMFEDERRALSAWGYPTAAGYMESNCNPPTPWYKQ
jgi:hypothetical protein